MKKILQISCLCFILLMSPMLAGCTSYRILGGSHTCKYNEHYSANHEMHWFDSICHDAEEQYRLNEEFHTYQEFIELEDGGFERSCSVCGFTQKTPKKNYILEDSENGTVEVVVEESGRTVLLPVPDEGYYFSHWEKASSTVNLGEEIEVGGISFDKFDAVQTISVFEEDDITVGPMSAWVRITSYKPVFTDKKPTNYVDVQLNVYSESTQDIDIWYLPYCSNAGSFTYYLRENTNVVIDKEERVSTTNALTTNDKLPQQAPYIGSVLSSRTNVLASVNLYIKDAV